MNLTKKKENKIWNKDKELNHNTSMSKCRVNILWSCILGGNQLTNKRIESNSNEVWNSMNLLFKWHFPCFHPCCFVSSLMKLMNMWHASNLWLWNLLLKWNTFFCIQSCKGTCILFSTHFFFFFLFFWNMKFGHLTRGGLIWKLPYLYILYL